MIIPDAASMILLFAGLGIGWLLLVKKIFRLDISRDETPSPKFKKVRMEALSDGVFSVALTLLIVDMSTSENIDRFYNSDWSAFQPEFLSFLYSAFVVAMFWVAHHNEMNLIERPDRTFLWLNFAFLACIVFIPFSAALLAKHWDLAESQGAFVSRLPVLVYASNLLAAGLCLQILWWWATPNLLKLGLSPLATSRTRWRNWLIPAASISVMLVSLVLPQWGPWVIVAVPAIYVAYTLAVASWIKRRREANPS